MRVIVERSGEQAGIMSIYQALEMAEGLGLDLVEVAPNATPPVCKIMDYGKFKYSEQKKQHQSKLKQKKVQTKEIKMRPMTDEHDFQTKLKKVKQFLAEGDKVKLVIQFRGRELAYKDIGLRHFDRIKEEFKDTIIIEHAARIDGRNAVMVIAPNPKTLTTNTAKTEEDEA